MSQQMKIIETEKPKTLLEIDEQFYLLCEEHAYIGDMIEVAGGVITDEQVERLTFIETLIDGLDMPWKERITATVKAMRYMAMRVDMADDRIKYHQRKKRTRKNTYEFLQRRIIASMDQKGLEKVELDDFGVRVQISPVTVEPSATQRFPKRFTVPVPRRKFSKKLALAYLREQGKVPTTPGTYRHDGLIVKRGRHLRIR